MNNEFLECDVLILGSGIAGLTTAISLIDAGLKVAVIRKDDDLKESNTYWAQGGIIYPNQERWEGLEEDIQAASGKTSSPEAIAILRHWAEKVVNDILIKKANVPFQKNAEGDLVYTREAAHSIPRIIYKGDKTGSEIEKSLWDYLIAHNFKGLKILKNVTAIDLITSAHHGVSIKQRYEKPKVLGAYLFEQDSGKVIKCLAKKTVLATGGVGSIYLHHTNAIGARGDGHAMASRAGAYLTNMEFIQFHPTTFYEPTKHRRFLISEAIRGEGGVITDVKGKRFMHRYHPDGELAPRDVVSRAILQQLIETGDEYVLLNISHKESSWIKERFPSIYDYCLNRGIDITVQPIPVVPAAHYSCGGVWVDHESKTTLESLYAVGEVACTGLHGANRLASTSLLEGLVWAYIAAEHIKKNIEYEKNYPHGLIKDWILGHKTVDLNLVAQDWSTLRQTMWNYVGIKRSQQRLKRAKSMFTELYDEIHRFYKDSILHDQLIGLRNGVEVGNMILKSSMKNQHSVGAFYLEED